MFKVKDTQWKGKKVGFLGDSITEGVGVNSGECFWNHLEGSLGIIPCVYGKSGAIFRELREQVDTMFYECEDQLDAIIIFAGTNDYNDGFPMGKWYNEPVECDVIVDYDGDKPIYARRKKREFNTDTSTFRGSINSVMSRIMEYYPTKQIIIMTPLHRAYANFGGSNIQYDELHTDKGGYYLDEYINVIKEVPNVWACEIIDLNAKSGLFPLNDIQAELFFCNSSTDRLHPNAVGHKRIADVMEAAMMNISVF